MDCFGPSEPEQWSAEKRLTIEQRRARYKCGANYVTLAAIPPWSQTGVQPPKADNAAPAAASAKKDDSSDRGMDFEKDKDNEKREEAKSEGGMQPLDRVYLPEVTVKVNPEINAKISLWRGNITTLEIDAIVNAANERCLGGGGIDGAIHNAAGEGLYEECKMLPAREIQRVEVRCPEGQTKITRGYNLPAKFVLHTVGPKGENEAMLESAYKTVLSYAGKHGIRTIALCGVSTGIFGYPLYKASNVACRVVRKWLESSSNRKKVDRIIFCVFLDKEEICYDTLLRIYFPLK